MRRILSKRALTLLPLLTVLGIVSAALAVRAADHADSPDTSQNNLDINDIYAFNRGSDVVFVMTVAPLLTPGERTEGAALNPRGLYEFKLDAERDGVAEAVIQVATAGAGNDQTVTYRGPVPPETSGTTGRVVPGPFLRASFGETASGEGMTAWAGTSDDPFFIDLFGDRSLTSVLNAAFGAALGTRIGDPDEQTLAFSDPARDDLAGLNTISIVVQVPKAIVAEALGIEAD
ncbi:MAG TPA: DUF4331 family protein, partial [Longimicrobiales bacterium]|nr:DUF4331 family protein [Longimicrobiales bacterium]